MARERDFDLVLSYMVGSHLCLIHNLLFNPKQCGLFGQLRRRGGGGGG